MFTLTIEQWQAWAPGLNDAQGWLQWARSPYCPYPASETGSLPSPAFLPPMQRRRLSPLARMAVNCAWPLAEGLPPMPMIFASRHGETSRSFKLLHDLGASEPLSPASFGLSVHNAIPGLWSIIRKETTEGVALSGDADMLEHALQEAALLLRAGAPRVLVVAAEEHPPEAYQPWIDDVPFSYATAFRVADSAQWRIDLEANPTQADPAAQTDGDAIWPHPLNLLRHLILRTPSWQHVCPPRRWTWTRCPAT